MYLWYRLFMTPNLSIHRVLPGLPTSIDDLHYSPNMIVNYRPRNGRKAELALKTIGNHFQLEQRQKCRSRSL